jgi:hypothetical protein
VVEVVAVRVEQALEHLEHQTVLAHKLSQGVRLAAKVFQVALVTLIRATAAQVAPA